VGGPRHLGALHRGARGGASGAAIPAVMVYNFFLNADEALGDGEEGFIGSYLAERVRRPCQVWREWRKMAIKVAAPQRGGGYRIAWVRALAETSIISARRRDSGACWLIFMLTAPLMTGGIDVNLPKTSGQGPSRDREADGPDPVQERPSTSPRSRVWPALLPRGRRLRDLFKNASRSKPLYLRRGRKPALQ